MKNLAALPTKPAKKLKQLRRNYPVFHYEGFRIDQVGDSFLLQFHYRVPPDFRFITRTVLETAGGRFGAIPTTAIENLVFHLGIIEAFSYWKATCSPAIVIEAGGLDGDQLEWWKDLLLHGMREFFYVNRIEFTADDFVTFSARKPSGAGSHNGPLSDRSLVPIGGGRDSAFTARALQQAGKRFECMLVNPTAAARRVASAAGCVQPVLINRRLDPRLLELNAAGYLNGHTPFSAMLAFLSALCMAVYDCSNTVIANERSSDEGNTTYLGESVNHQYSKSFEFEEKFDRYLQKYLLGNARYFSFVRPLYELQIGRAFARYPEMFGAFRSCNRNQKTDSWCGSCPKCLSVFMTSYPFVSEAELASMFGADFFQQEGSIPIIRKLAGLDEHKPFECVTTVDEAIASLHLCVRKCESEQRPLPLALQHARDAILSSDGRDAHLASRILSSEDTRHRIPADFESVLRAAVRE